MKMDIHLKTEINLHLHIPCTVKFSLHVCTSVINLKKLIYLILSYFIKIFKCTLMKKLYLATLHKTFQ
jgi:hypothetical protein